MRTRVKICGLTRPEDVHAAIDAGADALGMVFYAPSPRNIDLARAHEIASLVPAFITLVGLFVNASREDVNHVLDKVPLTLLQFHGDEQPDFCESFGKDYIKALRVGSGGVGSKEAGSEEVDSESGLFGDSLRKEINSYDSSCGVLLDTYRKGTPGGTGEQFDWGLVPDSDAINCKPVVLAGGLKPENVASAITAVRPYAVDVSGGVENAPGIKDADKIRAFISSVREADQALRSNERGANSLSRQ